MPLRREPAPLCAFAKIVLTNDVAFRVRAMLHCGLSINRTLDYLDKVISSLAPPLATDLGQTALRCTDLFCERSPLAPSLLHLLVRVLIHANTTAFQITDLHSYQLRQAVLTRICELRHLKTYYNPQYFHENVNISSTLQRLQSLSHLKQVYLSHWCSDDIAHLLGKACPNLQLLDAQSSLSLTDSSVPSLSRCKRLEVLLIYSTSISDNGYEKLLESLPLLQKIGPCHRLNFIIAKIKANLKDYFPLSLREYESTEIPDEDVAYMCPHLTRVHLYGTKPSNDSKLPPHVTHFKLQANGNNLSTMLTSSIIHLDLFEYPITEENMTAIANVCEQLRVLRLNPPLLDNQLRLVARKQEPFRHLEELDMPDSALALDILLVSQNIRMVHVQPQKCLSPFSLQSPFWTDAVLRKLLAKNPLLFLESLYLSTRCMFSVKTLFSFLQACPRIGCVGNIHTWGRAWETKIHEIYPVLNKHNLAVELLP